MISVHLRERNALMKGSHIIRQRVFIDIRNTMHFSTDSQVPYLQDGKHYILLQVIVKKTFSRTFLDTAYIKILRVINPTSQFYSFKVLKLLIKYQNSMKNVDNKNNFPLLIL